MKTRLCIALLLMTAGPALAAPEFKPFEGRNTIREGDGGARKTVDGIDIWSEGDPPRRYQLIGVLVDERSSSGIWGMIRMGNYESDIAKAVKKAGGDAVILRSGKEAVVGIAGSSFGTASGDSFGSSWNAFGSGFGSLSQVTEHHSNFWVVKYLPDAPLPAPAPTPEGAPAAAAPAAPVAATPPAAPVALAPAAPQ